MFQFLTDMSVQFLTEVSLFIATVPNPPGPAQSLIVSHFSIYESVYSVTGGVGIHPFSKHFNKSFSE